MEGEGGLDGLPSAQNVWLRSILFGILGSYLGIVLVGNREGFALGTETRRWKGKEGDEKGASYSGDCLGHAVAVRCQCTLLQIVVQRAALA